MELVRKLGWASLLVASLAVAWGAANWKRLDGTTLSVQMDRVVERSQEIRDRARPDYQEVALRALPPNPLTGPVFRLDDRLADARALAAPEAGDDTGGIVFELEFDAENPFVAAASETKLAVEDGVLRIDTSGHDHLLTESTDMAIPMDTVGDLIIRARVDRGKEILLAWSTETEPENPWQNRLGIPVISNGEFHTYVIDARLEMKRGVRTGSDLRRLYLRPSNEADDHVEIEFIRFVSKRSRYALAPRGVDYERVGQELRRVLYVLPDQVLEWTLRVPEDEPRLDFGTGVLLEGEPVSFRVEVVADGETTLVHQASQRAEDPWRDVRVALSRWAGRDVGLRLSVSGSTENVAFWSSPIVSGRPAEPFNVIVLIEDTMRADHLSVYGYERKTTPSKEELMAEDGVVFLRMASQSTKTRTSVPSLLTSLLPTTTGVWNFADTLSDAYLTLPEILRQQGFVTASFVQNGNAGPYAGLHQGFSALFDAEMIGTETEQGLGDRLDRWIDRNADRNFFLYLHLMDPHGIYDPKPPYDAYYRELTAQGERQEFDPHLDPEWMEHPSIEGRRRLYDGEIRSNDAKLADFVERLRAKGLYDRTLIVFTSDHGEHLGERGLWEHKPPGFLTVTGVPLMMVYPRRFDGGRRVWENTQTIDVMPTVLELARVPSDPLLIQGDSLVALVEDRNVGFWRDRVTLSEEPDVMERAKPSRNRGIRVGGSFFYRNWHFIASRRFWPERGYWPEALRMKVFDIDADPDEESALWSFLGDPWAHYIYATLLNEVQANNIEAWRRITENDSSTGHRFEPEVLDQLKALGYIE